MNRAQHEMLATATKLFDKGEFGKAIAKICQFEPSQLSPEAFHLRARCYRALGLNEEALKDLNAVLEADPNNREAYHDRAQLHFLAKRPDLAMADNQAAAQCRAANGMDEESEADELFDRVYDAREAFFEDNFGIMPADVLKLNNMMGVWPGGCLVQIYASEIDGNPTVTATFGLTNPDMPARVRSEDVVHEERTEGDKVLRSTSMKLVAREPVAVPPGLAGYGYEALVLTPDEAEWPTLFLSWFVTNEINHDAGFLARVLDEGAVLLKCPLRDHPRLKLLLAPAAKPLAERFVLPNGAAHLLVATAINEDEYAFGMKEGGKKLLKKLLASPTAQLSVLFRQSCI